MNWGSQSVPGGSGSITGYIAAVAVQHVEVDEVDEGQALKVAVGQIQRDLQALSVWAGARILCADAFLPAKNVVDLATPMVDLPAGSLDSVQHRITRRHQAVVVAARVRVNWRSNPTNGRGDDAAYAVFATSSSRAWAQIS